MLSTIKTSLIRLTGAVLWCGLMGSAHAANPVIQGAGSSAAAPIYQSWAQAYRKVSGATLAYDTVGSTQGLAQVRAKATHFGASDVAPTPQELERDGLMAFPVAATGIVPVFNLPKSVGTSIRLTGDVLARIFLGEINQWNDAAIAQLNPTIALPKLSIKVVVRADGSGTTYNFADYLAKVSVRWRDTRGVKSQFTWPDEYVQVKGSTGVATAVKNTVGAIGYVDFGYAKTYGLSSAHVPSKDGAWVAPSMDTFRRALMQSDWINNGNFQGTLTQQPGFDAWPLTMGTFVVVPKKTAQPENLIQAMRFFMWSFTHGDMLVKDHSFVRLPDVLQANAFKIMASIRDASGEPIGDRVITGLPQ